MRSKHLWLALVSLASILPLSGCRYAQNRVADFTDIFQMGVGVATENPKAGILPPSLGVYVQATEFINLGAMHFSGVSAEWDGRGFFAGPESRTRLGFLPMQWVQIDQDYEKGSENYFKKVDALWTKRMNSKAMRWWNKPAKELEYEYWAVPLHEGVPIMHRGWQYWENFNVEASVSEPFLTHFGLNVRLGFDPSEIFDFVLGWTTLDFKRDDLNEGEFQEKATGITGEVSKAPVQQQVTETAAPTESGRPTGTPVTDPNLRIIYFDYDKSLIRSDQVPTIQANADYLKANPNIKVQVEGHCDERNTLEYNLALGERRARAAMEWLIANGVAADRITMVSKGEEEPADPGHDEAAWAKNRRAVFLRFQ